MARRRRRLVSPRQSTPNFGLIAVQIIVLTLFLIALLGFRDRFGLVTSSVITSLGSEDLQVQPYSDLPDEESDEQESRSRIED